MFSRVLLAVLTALAIGVAASCAQAAIPGPTGSTAPNYSSFHERLASQGTWTRSAHWGEVWRPGIAGFRPYYDRGHWTYTADYGWYWIANDPWGDIVFHYGRWVSDPALGWVWIPGYVWGPSWVVWRWGDGYAGWMSAPPDYAFLTGGLDIGFSFGVWDVGFYGYEGWYGGAVVPASLWVFVGAGHLTDVGFARFAAPRVAVAGLIARTRDATRFSLRNGFVANGGPDVRAVERASGHSIARVSATTLARSDFRPVAASAGRAVAMREMREHPVAASALKSVRESRAAARAATRVTHTVRATRYSAARVGGARYGTAVHARTTTRTTARSRSSERTPGYARPYHASGFARQTSRPMGNTGAMHGPTGGAVHAPAPAESTGGHAAAPGRKPGG